MFLGFEAYGFAAISEAPEDRIYFGGNSGFTLDWEVLIFAATHEYISRNTDDPIDQPFLGTLEKAFRLDRSIIGSDKIGEAVTIGVGEITLSNVEGDYDFLAVDHSPLGQRVVIKVGDRRRPYSTWKLVLNGFLTDMTLDRDQVTFRARDSGHLLDFPSSPNSYLGTGSTEGTSDLKDKRKPRWFGHLQNVTPPLVIPSVLAYQLNDGQIDAVTAVYVRGVSLSLDANYASVALMNAATLSIGEYATCVAEGWIRIAVASDEELGEVTCDFRGDKADGIFVDKAADIVRRLLGATELVDPDDLVTASYTALNLVQPAPLCFGVPVGSEETVAQSVGRIMSSIGGWCGSRRTGKFEVRRFEAPVDTIQVGNDTFTKVLLHFDFDFNDTNAGGSAHTWTLSDTPTLDTSIKKFGAGSAFFSGGGGGNTDYLSTPAHADFVFGSEEWTVDAQFRVGSTGIQRYLGGQAHSSGAATASAWHIKMRTDSKLEANVFVGATVYTVVGVTVLTVGAFHYLQFKRSGDILRLLLDGVQEGSDVAISGEVNSVATALTIGRGGDIAAGVWHGWIDEFRLSVGIARDNNPPTQAYTTPVSSAITGRYDKTNVEAPSVGALPSALVPPPWRVRIGYARNWTPNQTNLAGSVTEERRAFLVEELRFAAAEDDDVRLNFPPGHELVEDDTFFREEADALTEAARKLALYGPGGTLYSFKLCEALYVHDLGQVIHLQFDDRFDLDEGKLLRIVKIEEDDREGVSLTAFG